eukprot:scaffold3871_cov97-Isochrysis_galbana.AAC.16
MQGYRWAGLSDQMTDRKVIEDYVRKNAAAAVNVIYASPTFYFLFAKMHGQSWLVSSVRVRWERRRPFFFSPCRSPFGSLTPERGRGRGASTARPAKTGGAAARPHQAEPSQGSHPALRPPSPISNPPTPPHPLAHTHAHPPTHTLSPRLRTPSTSLPLGADPFAPYLGAWARAALTRIPRPVQAMTGTMRIIPFMGFFYSSFALICPFVTDAMMRRGQSYAEAQSTAGTAVMLSGFVFVEAVVELRGCGVTFAQVRANTARGGGRLFLDAGSRLMSTVYAHD